MAIDSREKRASIVGLNYISGPSPTPNAAKDQEWRQEVGYSYSGILAGGAAVVVGISANSIHYDGMGIMNFRAGRI